MISVVKGRCWRETSMAICMALDGAITEGSVTRLVRSRYTFWVSQKDYLHVLISNESSSWKAGKQKLLIGHEHMQYATLFSAMN